jgi:ABC-type nitrate/sulfonate/bicarbonate transport system substrate-binding protein
MERPSLSAVTRTQGNNRALKQGIVQPSRYEFDFIEVPVLTDAFRRMVREQAYMVCEMALTTYLCAKEYGTPFTALPVFLVRGFHHGAIVTSANAGVTEPKQLEGRRVGVSRGYTVTTGVWARGVLAQEYGVDLGAVTWVLSGDEHVAEYRPPANVEPMPAGQTLADLLVAGELAAAIGLDPDPERGIVPLIPDAAQAGYRALHERGHYPINHLVVVRDDVLAAHPDVAADVMTAFLTAKQRYVDELRAGSLANPTAVDRLHARVSELTGRDPLPYGIEPNESVLSELIDLALGQGILGRRPELASLFAAGTHDIVG